MSARSTRKAPCSGRAAHFVWTKLPLLFALVALAGCTAPKMATPTANVPAPTTTPVVSSLVGLPPAPDWHDLFDDVVIHGQTPGWSMARQEPEPSGRGIAHNLIRQEHVGLDPLVRPSTRLVEADSDVDLAFELTITNTNLAFTPFLLSVFSNFQQIPFTLDSKSGLLHEVNLPAGETTLLPLSLGRLSPGAHDIQLVIFVDPYRAYGYDSSYVSQAHSNVTRFHEVLDGLRTMAASHRMLVIVDGDSEPVRPPNTQVQFAGTEPAGGKPSGADPWFAQPGTVHPFLDQSQILRAAEVDPGATLPFRIWSGQCSKLAYAHWSCCLTIDRCRSTATTY